MYSDRLSGLVTYLRNNGTRALLRYVMDRPKRIQARNEAASIVATFNDFYFTELGVERNSAESLANDVISKVPLSEMDLDRLRNDVRSFHYTAFAALAISGFRPTTILELGTFLGHTTSYLSLLFPDARIYTFDLPKTDPHFGGYWRLEGKDIENLHKQRLGKSNIIARKINSFFIWKEEVPEVDLVWLDAGHHYPVVASDHFYAMSKLSMGGWIFSDDIYKREESVREGVNQKYDGFDTIDYINSRCEKKFRLLLKREDVDSYIATRKYIAFLHQSA